jgi:hypothetical protein
LQLGCNQFFPIAEVVRVAGKARNGWADARCFVQTDL